jgi:hypothetical protein
MFNYDRDFDAFDLRLRLPAVVSKLHKLVNCNGGVTYIHCTAGLGRAPAVAVGLHSLFSPKTAYRFTESFCFSRDPFAAVGLHCFSYIADQVE